MNRDHRTVVRGWTRWGLVVLLGGVGVATSLATSPPCSATDPCPIERLELEPGTMVLYVGDKSALSLNVYDSQGNKVSGDLVERYDIEWQSSDGSVATVDTAGVVTAVDVGTSLITAAGRFGGSGIITADALVTVNARQ